MMNDGSRSDDRRRTAGAIGGSPAQLLYIIPPDIFGSKQPCPKLPDTLTMSDLQATKATAMRLHHLILAVVLMLAFSPAKAFPFYLLCGNAEKHTLSTPITLLIDETSKSFSRFGVYDKDFVMTPFKVTVMDAKSIKASTVETKELTRQTWLINRISGDALLYLGDNNLIRSVLKCEKARRRF